MCPSLRNSSRTTLVYHEAHGPRICQPSLLGWRAGQTSVLFRLSRFGSRRWNLARCPDGVWPSLAARGDDAIIAGRSQANSRSSGQSHAGNRSQVYSIPKQPREAAEQVRLTPCPSNVRGSESTGSFSFEESTTLVNRGYQRPSTLAWIQSFDCCALSTCGDSNLPQ